MTVNVACVVPLFPSVTVTSLMLRWAASSFWIVPAPCASVIVTSRLAAWTFVRFTKKVSFRSTSVSPITGTLTVCVPAAPAAKVSVPVALV